MSYCVVRCWCCTTPCTTLYDASYIPDASGPDALYDTVRRVVRSRRVGPRRLVRRPDASYNAFPTVLHRGAHDTRGNHEGSRNAHEQHRNGVIRPHAHGRVGTQVVDDQDNMWRGGATGPHAHRNVARHVVDDLKVEGSRQQKPVKRPPQQPAQPQYAKYWARVTQKPHHREHRLQRPSEHNGPSQHAMGRPGHCPGPHKETATRRNVTQGAALSLALSLSLSFSLSLSCGLGPPPQGLRCHKTPSSLRLHSAPPPKPQHQTQPTFAMNNTGKPPTPSVSHNPMTSVASTAAPLARTHSPSVPAACAPVPPGHTGSAAHPSGEPCTAPATAPAAPRSLVGSTFSTPPAAPLASLLPGSARGSPSVPCTATPSAPFAVPSAASTPSPFVAPSPHHPPFATPAGRVASASPPFVPGPTRLFQSPGDNHSQCSLQSQASMPGLL